MRGLPQKDAYETVLRDALVADSLQPMGIYLGTRSGQLFVSCDDGKSWKKIMEGLPPVLCIRNSFIQDTAFGSAEAALPQPAAGASSRRSTSGAIKSRSSASKSRTSASKSRRRKS